LENERKAKLIELIKNFENTCSECGMFFLGLLIKGSTEVGAYPVYVGTANYPLTCGKCPGCAEECYHNLYKYIEENNKLPCVDDIFDDDADIEDFVRELSCYRYLEENFQYESMGNGNPNVNGGELIDLFSLIEENIKDITTSNESKRN